MEPRKLSSRYKNLRFNNGKMKSERRIGILPQIPCIYEVGNSEFADVSRIIVRSSNPVRIVYTQGIPVPRRHEQQGDAMLSGNLPHSTDAGDLLLRW